MNPEQQKSLLAIALCTAFADDTKHDREREEICRIAEFLGGEDGAPDLARTYQDVLLKRVTQESTAAVLADPGERQLADEMAVCVCDAGGRQSEPEQPFLMGLKTLLKLDAGQIAAFEHEADAIVDLGESAAPTAGATLASGPVGAARPTVTKAALDKSILNHALIDGALELLPQSCASMAMIALQIKMVYGIGKAHGVELDQGHIKEFIAAAGVGLTSQYLEQFRRKLLGAGCSARPLARPSVISAAPPPTWPSPSPPPTLSGKCPNAGHGAGDGDGARSLIVTRFFSPIYQHMPPG